MWTLLAAGLGLWYPAAAVLGTPVAFQRGMALLMVSMGLTLRAKDLGQALRVPRAIALNAACCFGLMPALAVAVGACLRSGVPAAGAASSDFMQAGLILLGSVSGGQASNLCALLAGGDVALSVVLTVSTTLLGVFVTPAIVQLLLGGTLPVDSLAVLWSTASFVLAPLLSGLLVGRYLPGLASCLAPFCPAVGVVATLLLVAGGAANSAALLLGGAGCWQAHAGSIALPLAGFFISLGMARAFGFEERAVRTIAVETLVKSPTLAYVLAVRHFNADVAAVPAAAMVWLATLGASVATLWSRSRASAKGT